MWGIPEPVETRLQFPRKPDAQTSAPFTARITTEAMAAKATGFVAASSVLNLFKRRANETYFGRESTSIPYLMNAPTKPVSRPMTMAMNTSNRESENEGMLK